MTSSITGYRVWNIKLFLVYCDVIMPNANWFYCLVLNYVVPVISMCCDLSDKIWI